MMLCVFFFYLHSGISDNKHELIQDVPANITTHKFINKSKDNHAKGYIKHNEYLYSISLIHEVTRRLHSKFHKLHIVFGHRVLRTVLMALIY